MMQNSYWRPAIRLVCAFFMFGAAIFSCSADETVLPVKPEGQAWLSLPVSGVVDQVFVKSGDRVKKGDKLVVLELGPAKFEFKAADSLVQAAKAESDEQKRSLGRARELFDRTLLSVVELQRAELAFKHAEAAYMNAWWKRVQARYRLDKSVLQAPFDGTVAARRVEPGEVIAADLAPRVLIVMER